MKKVNVIVMLLVVFILASCVSKKKYVALENQYSETKSTLTKTKLENEKLEQRLLSIDQKVEAYYSRIQSLSEDNTTLSNLSKTRLQKFGNVVLSEKDKELMKSNLAKVDASKLQQAKTLQDSLNLLVSYNLKKGLANSDVNTIEGQPEEDGIDINIDETVVMITISDKLLFTSGSYRINPKAYPLLEKLANLINNEPAVEVMVEGHTDAQTVKPGAIVKDNWDLSVERSTAVIRVLQEKYGVNPQKLIAAGRSSYLPLTENETKEGRATNRRTRIVILPNLDKFLALLSEK